ncbi:MAG: hypothetical protein IKJ33_05305 [Clostridia bacterium]|nr:hypothetical protein [Clostridia bacterium]
MKFEICEREDREYFVIDLSENCFKNFKEKYASIECFEIEQNALNLGISLYGQTKKESVEIQKKNCEQVLKLFKVCKKIVKFLKHKKVAFDGKFYTKGLDEKKNNNDFMIVSMLDVEFNVKPFKKLAASYKYAADYLDMENSLNKMCDFRDNKCTKYREIKSDRTTGCCSKLICKYTCNAPCPTWNLACKIIMCDYIIDKKGFYFTPHTVPIMRRHFSFLERCFSIGQLCRTKKRALFELWTLRGFGLLAFLSLIGFITILFI